MDFKWYTYAYAFGTGLVMIAIALRMPKRHSVTVMYITALFSTLLQLITDIILDAKYDWYGYFYHGPDVYSVLACLLIYPPFNAIYLNYFPYGQRVMKQIAYIFAYCVFAVVYEWTAVQSGYFYYNGWKLWYSALVYPFLFLLLSVHGYGVMKLAGKKTRKGRS
ncbi:CBO0543 family protein [Paenibacillus aurantiacus]|uniref:CBO0543 family protein n=1 Tax=Paenibacillus aurantiacus TaxID=1936118 RepID=A0ABV5KXR7_9BACL